MTGRVAVSWRTSQALWFLSLLLLLLLRESGAVRGASSTRDLMTQRRRNAFSPRIVGGNTARAGRYPYAQISLATEAGLHQCGGSLIAPDIILTAGHCHGFFNHIRVNIYNLKQELQSFEVFKAEKMHFHPNFDELWFRYDFLLLQLNGTVQGMQPVQINSDVNIPVPNDPLTVVGWGLTDPEDSTAYPDELREVTVNYMSNEACEQTSSKGQRLYQGYIFNDMLCAFDSGQDACSGDSGAPLIRPGSSPAQDVVVAVVSWGNGCATDYPGVYARLSYQYEWIKELVCSLSSAPPASFRCPANSGSNQVVGSNTNNNNPSFANSPKPTPSPFLQVKPITPTPTPLKIPEGHVPIKVEIQLDLRSKDTGWSLVSSNDGRILAEVEPGAYAQPYELVEQVVPLPKSSQFVFIVTDTEGDGICCEFGGGWFQVSVVMSDGTTDPLVKGYGTFSLSTTHVFSTPADNDPLPLLELNEPAATQPVAPAVALTPGASPVLAHQQHAPTIQLPLSNKLPKSAAAGTRSFLAAGMLTAAMLLYSAFQ